MAGKKGEAITLGVDAGGKDADEATRPHYLALRRLLARECAGPYGRVFREFALILRLDGSVQAWKKSGVANIRLQKKLGYATADIFIPVDRWKRRSPKTIQRVLASGVEAAIDQIVERAAASQVKIDAERLLLDVRRATKKFLARRRKIARPR